MYIVAPSPTADMTQARLREAVEALSGIERRATTTGERRSAEWVADALREAGAREVRLTAYTAHSIWAIATSAHAVLGLVASLGADVLARALAAAALVSLEA